MIKVVAKFTVKEGNVEKLKSYAALMVAETVKEEGCIAYQLCQETVNERKMAMIEEWESQEALDRHMKAAHFLEYIPKMHQLQEGETEVNLYHVLF